MRIANSGGEDRTIARSERSCTACASPTSPRMTPRSRRSHKFGAASAITMTRPHGGLEVSTELATPQSTGPPAPSATTGPRESLWHTSDPRVAAMTRPVEVISKDRDAWFSTSRRLLRRPVPASRRPGGGRELRRAAVDGGGGAGGEEEGGSDGESGQNSSMAMSHGGDGPKQRVGGNFPSPWLAW
jgi:hypothetical protein